MSLSRAFFIVCAVTVVGCGSEISQPVDAEPTTWVRRVGRGSDSEPVGLATFADGGVVMAGRYYGEIDFGGGKLPSPNENYQAFVVKYDGFGKHVYSKSFGGEFAEAATDVVTFSDGSVLVAGSFNWPVDFGTGQLSPSGTDVFVLKLDASGKTIWAQTYGGEGSQRPVALATTADGGAVLVGTTSGQLDFGLGSVVDTSGDAFVLRMDAQGKPVWSDMLTSDTGVYVTDVAVHSVDGVIAVGGGFDNQLTIGALPDLVANGYHDGFLAVYDNTGKAKWSRTVGGPGYSDSVNAIVMAPKESTIYMTGQVEGPVDLGGGPLGLPDQYDPNTYVLSVATTGGYLAGRLYGKQSNDAAYGLAMDGEGNLYLAGEFYDRIAFGAVELVSKGNSDAFVGKIRPNLEPASQQGWGDSERQTAYRVAVDGTGRVYVAGSVFGTVDFGIGPTYGSGYYETFLVALPR
jgi:hypothetical protein